MEWLGVDRKRLGTAMLVFGIVGLLLAAVVAVTLVAGGIAAQSLDHRVVAGQDRIAASLTRLTLTMDSVATSVDHGSATLATSRDSVAQAVDVLGELAGTSDALASALDVSVLGDRPFTAAVTQLHDMATRMRTFQDDATRLAADLDQDASDATQIAGEVRAMRSQVAELAGGVTGLTGGRDVVSFALGGIVLAGLLTAWTAVLAGAIAWAGLRLRHHAARALLGAAAADADISLSPLEPAPPSASASAEAPTSTWASTSASASISPLDTIIPPADDASRES
ncbi:MAG: hypothetical protein ACYDAN_02145 [Candidatus Limnocylindrales bacterium]